MGFDMTVVCLFLQIIFTRFETASQYNGVFARARADEHDVVVHRADGWLAQRVLTTPLCSLCTQLKPRGRSL